LTHFSGWKAKPVNGRLLIVGQATGLPHKATSNAG
jgi:hypothetical protein